MDENNNFNNSFGNNEITPKNINQEATTGNISGFDAVNEPNSDDEQHGYTVTPQGGYYTRRGEDIIQDEVYSAPTEASKKTSNAEANHSKTDFRPNGSYGATSQNYSNGNTNYNPENLYGNYIKKPKKTKKIKKEKRSFSAATVVISALLAAVIGATSGICAVMWNNTQTTPLISENKTSNVNINVDETVESVAQAVAAKVSSSVVGIRTTTSVMSFFGGSSESTGEGSGVVYSSDGYIITNYHVISSAVNSSNSKIEVFLESSDAQSYQATVVGYNISSDLAVIKIDAQGLSAVETGDSSELKVGQYVVTIGSPGGLEFMGSVTYGIISGLDRVVSSASNVSLIQTDAAINPGNSGGALLNTKGQLIGINSSKIVSEEYEGMGFAIPINTVIEKCDKIIARQNEPEPYIGIAFSEKYTAQVLEYYGFPTGAVVLSVDDGSPADNAGIRKGDIITEFNGTKLSDYTMFNDILLDCEPGSKVAVKVYRSGRYYSADIEIESNTQKN